MPLARSGQCKSPGPNPPARLVGRPGSHARTWTACRLDKPTSSPGGQCATNQRKGAISVCKNRSTSTGIANSETRTTCMHTGGGVCCAFAAGGTNDVSHHFCSVWQVGYLCLVLRRFAELPQEQWSTRLQNIVCLAQWAAVNSTKRPAQRQCIQGSDNNDRLRDKLKQNVLREKPVPVEALQAGRDPGSPTW